MTIILSIILIIGLGLAVGLDWHWIGLIVIVYLAEKELKESDNIWYNF